MVIESPSVPRAHDVDSRAQRNVPEELTDAQRTGENPEYRVDLERIRFSPYFARLSGVTQVISQAGTGTLIHNRLTHSLKVAAVARSIAVNVDTKLLGADSIIPADAGCDVVVVQAAASAHDLGHPPFGHLGEAVLDKLARERLGLEDGFEGNAQTWRIASTLDVGSSVGAGLNLTAAVRTAIAKYPWTSRVSELGFHAGMSRSELPRGISAASGQIVAKKYSAYFLDADDLDDARRAVVGAGELGQSLECSIMDIADDIAYSIHDLDDFYRAGVLGYVPIAREFEGWLAARASFERADEAQLRQLGNVPGCALENVRRKTRAEDPWIADSDAFAAAVRTVADDLVEGLLSTEYDGSIQADRALSAFAARWIARLQDAIEPAPIDTVRTGLVSLDRPAWHEVQVLKFVHKHFVLARSDIALYQRGLGTVLTTLVEGFAGWLDDDFDRRRVPPRLREMVELATQGYERLARSRPELLSDTSGSELARLGRSRGIIDYVASMSDTQALSVAELIGGRSDRLWDTGRGL